MATLNLTQADLDRLVGSVPGLESLASPIPNGRELDEEAVTSMPTITCDPNARITKEEFFRDAMAYNAVLCDNRVDAQPKMFSTGSVGWRYNGKGIFYLMNGQQIEVQINLNITAIGSKDWPNTR